MLCSATSFAPRSQRSKAPLEGSFSLLDTPERLTTEIAKKAAEVAEKIDP